MIQLKKIAAGIGAALALAHGGSALALPVPGAFAESMLNLNNFQLRVGNGTSAISSTLINAAIGALPTGLQDLGITQVNSNGSTTSTLTPGNLSNTAAINGAGVGTNFDLRSYLGPGSVNAVGPLAPLNLTAAETSGKVGTEFGLGAGNAPGTANGPSFTSTFAGGASISHGNALTGQDTVIVHSITGIANGGVQGGNNGDQGLKSTSFTISVGTGAHVVGGKLKLELSFNADGYMENALSANGQTDTNFSWNFTVVDDDVGGPAVFSWTPSGNAVGSNFTCSIVGNCTEFASAFSLNQSASNQPFGIFGPTDKTIVNAPGAFQAELDLLAQHNYTLTLTHKTGAHAQLAAIPEPTTLALLGLGLVGAGVSRRRKS